MTYSASRANSSNRRASRSPSSAIWMVSRSAARNWPAEMRRRQSAWLACCWASLFFVIAAAEAVDWKALKPQGYVSDFAGAIDPQSRAALDEYAARVEKATGAQMALVAITTLQGEPLEDVANDIFHAWGIGQKNKDNGVMLLLVVQDHRSRLEDIVGDVFERFALQSRDGD